MKKIIICLLLIFTYCSLFSQQLIDSTEYWFALPYCKIKTPEYLRGDYPVLIHISSKVNTKATLTISEISYKKDIEIEANKITTVPLSDEVMCRESERITNKGINIKSEAPLSVTVYVYYKWTNEAFQVQPTKNLGKEYVTLNMYEDRSDELKPAQILIVATEDSTIVEYTPTKPTTNVNTGDTKQILMMKGQTYLILGRDNINLFQNFESDISGTYIKSNKPIAVFSGHTKGAFPRYYSGYSPSSAYGYVNYSRNLLIEQMLPFEMLGTEYISVPIKYLNRYRGLSGVTDDYGDLIRFVAIEDSTFVYQMRQDDSSLMQISAVLKPGEYHDITNQEKAAYYQANKPVLVGQYGKAWWSDPGYIGIIKNKDNTQNPTKSGTGMLLTITTIERWTTYSNFHSLSFCDNFICITFNIKDLDNIYLDGRKICSVWGAVFQKIEGTPYCYFNQFIQSGEHYLEGKNGAKFGAYAYGNFDRTKEGYAYGYPLDLNYAHICRDTISIKDVNFKGDIDADVFSVDIDTIDCAGLLDINYIKSKYYNYKVTIPDFTPGSKNAQFFLDVIDRFEKARVTMFARSLSGYTLEKTYKYYPPPILIAPPNASDSLPLMNKFLWHKAKYGDLYQLQIAKDENFENIVINELDISDTTIYKELEYSTKYYWRVRAIIGIDSSIWSDVWWFKIKDANSIENNSSIANVFQVFPNPADNELYIEFSNEFSNNCEIEIIDMQGNTVSSIKKSNLIYGTNKEQISLKDFPVGAYYCVLQIGGNRYSKMFVKM